MQKLPIPLPDSHWLMDHFRSFANPRAKIVRLERQKELIRLKRGLYVTARAVEENLPVGLIANRLYGPSYVSFEYALRLYGLIPEHVPNVTSATRSKHHTRRFDTPLCSFYYRDVREEAFPREIVYREESGVRYLVASSEKALCDQLSTIAGIRTLRSIEILLRDDLRIDLDDIAELRWKIIEDLAPLYKSTTLDTVVRFSRKNYQ